LRRLLALAAIEVFVWLILLASTFLISRVAFSITLGNASLLQRIATQVVRLLVSGIIAFSWLLIWKKVTDFWKEMTEASWIDTPDEAMNFLTNKWYRYQAVSARMWAKTAYYQCSGGIGFRDQLQDSNCLLESNPGMTRKQILTHAEQMFPDGTVYHW